MKIGLGEFTGRTALLMTSAGVAKSVIAGLANAATPFSPRITPRSLNAGISYKVLKP